MIPFEQAFESKFEASTLPELRQYYKERFGEDPSPKANGPTLKNKLLRAMGLTNEYAAQQRAVKQSADPIFPDYNLTPHGVWGGRRHRIRVARPADATKNENFWGGSINGANAYYIKYGEVQDVPEPVYMRIKELKRPVPRSVEVGDPRTPDVITEITLEDRHGITYLGVDPATAHRAGSLTEWYQNKGPSWFRARTDRDLQLIAQRVEIVWQDDKKRPLPRQEIQDKLIEFFFSYAEAMEDEAA